MFVTLVVASGVLVGSAFAVAGSSKPDMVALLPTDHRAHRADLRRHLHAAGQGALPLQRRPQEPGRRDGPVHGPELRRGDAGAVARTATRRSSPTRTRCPTRPGSEGTAASRSARSSSSIPARATTTGTSRRRPYYALLLPGGGVRSADKVGFCMWDSWVMDGGSARPSTSPSTTRARAHHMVRAQRPAGDLHADGHLAQLRRPVRGAVDRPVGRHQGAEAGELPDPGDRQPERVHRRVGPEQQHGHGHPDDPGHDRRRGRARTSPTARPPRSRSRARWSPPDVPARNNLAVGQGACQDVRKDLGCYLFTSANGPLTFSIGAKPTHGSLTIVNQSGTTANVKYTPQAGFSGTDSFTFTVVDKRKLQSLPATVTVNVA